MNTQTICSEASARHLLSMLKPSWESDCLKEWLTAAATFGRCAPETCLPGLLDYGAASPYYRDLVIPVLGERGRKLARIKPEWHYAAGGNDWSSATEDVRRVLFKQMRAADPALAREKLAEVWAPGRMESPGWFIHQLRVGLSPADEPFLESCLDGRRRFDAPSRKALLDAREQVTTAARETLARLPGSGLVRRTIERSERMIALVDGPDPFFEISLPEEVDAETRRDVGKVTKRNVFNGSRGLSKPGLELMAMVRLVPPAYWSKKWQRSPADLLEIAQRSRFGRALSAAWDWAAFLHRDPAWSAVFIRPGSHIGLALLPGLPASEVEKIVFERIDTPAFSSIQDKLILLDDAACVWNERFARLAIRLYQELLAQPAKRPPRVPYSLMCLGERMSPDLAGSARDILRLDDPKWADWSLYLQNEIRLLNFRYEMLQALAG